MPRWLEDRRIPILFFLAYLAIGLFIFSDYGLSWDEPISRYGGMVTLGYIAGGNPGVFPEIVRDYGTAFELPLVIAEGAMRLHDLRDVYLMRHFLTFLLFFFSVLVFYKLAGEIFQSRTLGLLGAFFLVLSPRIFAESFYNSKDIAALSAFILAIYTLSRFLKSPDWQWAALHAAASAFLTDIRIAGVLVIVVTCFFLAMEKRFSYLVVYLCFLPVFIYVMWPFLWASPLNNFAEAWRIMSRFPDHSSMLYMGEYINASATPWHYIPVWILITTPIFYILLFFAGLLSCLRTLSGDFAASGWYLKHREDFIIYIWLFAPYAGYLIFNSTVLDGWRHFYFIYPAFILVALSGFIALKKYLYALLVFGLINLSAILWFMIANHPYQSIYFNAFAGSAVQAKENFEFDYWGLSFRRGLEFIAESDKGPRIAVFFAYGIDNAIDILPEEDRARFLVTRNAGEADYILSNYRWHKGEYQPEDEFGARFREVYNIKTGGAKILSVFKRQK